MSVDAVEISMSMDAIQIAMSMDAIQMDGMGEWIGCLYGENWCEFVLV